MAKTNKQTKKNVFKLTAEFPHSISVLDAIDLSLRVQGPIAIVSSFDWDEGCFYENSFSCVKCRHWPFHLTINL